MGECGPVLPWDHNMCCRPPFECTEHAQNPCPSPPCPHASKLRSLPSPFCDMALPSLPHSFLCDTLLQSVQNLQKTCKLQISCIALLHSSGQGAKGRCAPESRGAHAGLAHYQRWDPGPVCPALKVGHGGGGLCLIIYKRQSQRPDINHQHESRNSRHRAH